MSSFTIGFRCPSPNKEDVCSHMKGRNFLTGCGKSNWFSAREKCKNNKGDLAILDSQREIGASMKTLAEQNLFTYCDKFYIGLFQENWVIINKDGGKKVKTEQSRFISGFIFGFTSRNFSGFSKW